MTRSTTSRSDTCRRLNKSFLNHVIFNLSSLNLYLYIYTFVHVETMMHTSSAMKPTRTKRLRPCIHDRTSVLYDVLPTIELRLPASNNASQSLYPTLQTCRVRTVPVTKEISTHVIRQLTHFLKLCSATRSPYQEYYF